MPIDNTVFLTGHVTGYPFFNRVPAGDEGTSPFTQFIVQVPRNWNQLPTFPSDRIRVVTYGDLAERYYPLLDAGTLVTIAGWLQYRNAPEHGSLLEVVAQRLTVVQVPDGLPAPRDNQVFLRGTVDREPFFNRVPGREGQDPFLAFHLNVPRGRSQPDDFPNDKIRVVLYGDAAQIYYPVLTRGTVVALKGWLQYRNIDPDRWVLEVVTNELVIGQSLQEAEPVQAEPAGGVQ